MHRNPGSSQWTVVSSDELLGSSLFPVECNCLCVAGVCCYPKPRRGGLFIEKRNPTRTILFLFFGGAKPQDHSLSARALCELSALKNLPTRRRKTKGGNGFAFDSLYKQVTPTGLLALQIISYGPGTRDLTWDRLRTTVLASAFGSRPSDFQ